MRVNVHPTLKYAEKPPGVWVLFHLGHDPRYGLPVLRYHDFFAAQLLDVFGAVSLEFCEWDAFHSSRLIRAAPFDHRFHHRAVP